MYPSEDFSSEEAYFEEWNNLSDIDNIINSHDEKIKVAQQIIKESTKERNYYIWTKKRMQAAKEEFSQVQWKISQKFFFWLFIIKFRS